MENAYSEQGVKVKSSKVLEAEIELERERKARLELEKEVEELKRKSQIMSDQLLYSKIQTAKQFTAARLYTKDVLYVIRK